MSRKIVVLSVVVVATVSLAAGLAAYRIMSGGQAPSGVVQALDRHQGELRAIPGVTMLGTHAFGTAPAHIIVWVHKVTPAIRVAVPDELDGYQVEIEVEPPPPVYPPVIEGRITHVTPATSEEAAGGIAGTVTMSGKLYARGMGAGDPVARELTILVPASVQIWRPQGEGKEFIAFRDIRDGESGQATLTAVPGTTARRATAGDLEVYGPM